jgi:enterochelin esterase-like enzyme
LPVKAAPASSRSLNQKQPRINAGPPITDLEDSVTDSLAEPVAIRRRLPRVLAAAALVAFVAVGAVGVFRYARGFWLYRGFPPPRDPAYVSAKGVAERLYVASPALGGRRQPVDVYLPPGYATSTARYPVFYLLHGFPGRPDAFLETVRLGIVEDVLLARHRIRPVILVMPFGSTGTFTDKEWANGVRPHEGWASFVAHDLVRAIDARYRTIRSGSARAIGGLSEGGYGAINIAVHHPREFRVVESWSGYELADPIRSLFGNDTKRLAANSPLLVLPREAAALRAARSYFWFYSGSGDRLLGQNRKFAAALARAGVAHRFLVRRGGHNWGLWRGNAAAALLATARRLP